MENVKERLLESLTIDIKKKEKISVLLLLPAIFALVWALLLFLSPLLLPSNSVYLGNEGKVSIMDNAPYINSHISNPFIRGIYLIGDVMCHQHANRSFFINGNQMPFCARCTGIFLGLAFGAFVGALFRVRVGTLFYLFIILLMGVDGFLQLVSSYESTNFIRIVTGNLVGTFTSMVFYYIYYDIHEFSRK